MGGQQSGAVLPRVEELGRVVHDDPPARVADRRGQVVADEDRDHGIGMLGLQDLARLGDPVHAGQQPGSRHRVPRRADADAGKAVRDRARRLLHDRVTDQRHPMHPNRCERQAMTCVHDGRTVDTGIRWTRPPPPPVPRNKPDRGYHRHHNSDGRPSPDRTQRRITPVAIDTA